MKTAEGKIFNNRPADEVIDFLKSNPHRYYTVSPRELEIVSDNSTLLLRIKQKQPCIFKLRTSFLHKLLKWYNLPINILEKLSEDFLIRMLNELLSQIKSYKVNIKVENDEALTITSELYTEFKDLEVYELIKGLEIKSISRNDFITRFYTGKKSETAPLVDDFYGFGFDIINSETGFSALSFNHYILRYTCRNGATAPINIYDTKKYHYCETRQSISQFLNEQINRSLKSREKLILAIKQSDDFPSIKFKSSTSAKLNYIFGNWKGSEFWKGFDWNKSMYELFNFVTHRAKNYSINQRYQLERLAGEIILN